MKARRGQPLGSVPKRPRPTGPGLFPAGEPGVEALFQCAEIVLTTKHRGFELDASTIVLHPVEDL